MTLFSITLADYTSSGVKARRSFVGNWVKLYRGPGLIAEEDVPHYSVAAKPTARC